MRVQRIRVSRKFEKQYRKIEREIKDIAKQKELIFRESPFAPRLKTHKLSGEEKDAWAFWINYSYRIKFIFLSDGEVLFLEIGKHDIYK